MILIDWNHFTYESALLGGVFIGAAISLLILFNGRIAGISGAIGGLFTPSAGNIAWRIAFLLGIFSAAIAFNTMSASDVAFDTSYPILIIAGFLIGFGSRLGSGCTSGHGVCGIARLSKRSFLATGLFIAAGMAAVYVMRHII